MFTQIKPALQPLACYTIASIPSLSLRTRNQNMKTNRLLTLTAAALFSSVIGFVQTGAMGALRKSNNDAGGTNGNFGQTVHSKKKTRTIYGTFKILRPGLFEWEHIKPCRQTIIGDGKTIRLCDVGLAQVTKSS